MSAPLIVARPPTQIIEMKAIASERPNESGATNCTT